jgi:hypothetical protein
MCRVDNDEAGADSAPASFIACIALAMVKNVVDVFRQHRQNAF